MNSHHTGSKNYVIYIGNFLDEKIVDDRGLPTFNVAGSNRMYRVAHALHAADQRVLLVSPSASGRMQWKGKLFHLAYLSRCRGIPVYFCSASGLGAVNALLEPISLLYAIAKLRRTICIKRAIIYNFSPSLLIVSWVLRCLWGIHLINNVEDISRPKLSDWFPKSEARPLQQIIFSVCMDAIAQLSDGFIVPTQRFLADLPRRKPAVVISGCMPSVRSPGIVLNPNLPLNILFSGKIEFEHGIQFLVEALKQLDQSETHNNFQQFQINICGQGSKSAWLEKQLLSVRHISINYHGFVDGETYRNLLAAADVCVALQDPSGRYDNYKTPSKVYEYLGSGKLVVSTVVGDLSSLPTEVIELCEEDVSHSLATILSRLIQTRPSINRRKLLAAQYSEQNFSYPVVGQQLKAFVLG